MSLRKAYQHPEAEPGGIAYDWPHDHPGGRRHDPDADLGRLPHRHALDSARPFHGECEGNPARPHAVCHGRTGWSDLDIEERRLLRAVRSEEHTSELQSL